MYKNIAKKEKITLADQIEYQAGQVVSKTLVQNDKVSMTLFSFDKGEEISTHAAAGRHRALHRRRRGVHSECGRNAHHAQGYPSRGLR